jgi:hypothetical protein
MKTATTILLPLFVAGLLLSGCSGLDDPDDGGRDREPSDYDGAFTLAINPPEAEAIDPPEAEPSGCSDANGVMRLNDGKVTGTATDLNTGETILLSGSVASDGFIEGALVFSFGGNTGSYSGLMKSSCDLGSTTTDCTEGGTGGDGTWKDTSDCIGVWTATK